MTQSIRRPRPIPLAQPPDAAPSGSRSAQRAEPDTEDTSVRRIAPRAPAARSGAGGQRLSRSASGFGLNVRLNGLARLVPVVADSPERLAPLAEALELAHSGAGFIGEVCRRTQPVAIVMLHGVEGARALRQRLDAEKAHWIGRMLDRLPRERRCLEPGLSLHVTNPEPGVLELLLHFDAPRVACAEELDELASGVVPALAALTRGQARLAASERAFERVSVECSIDQKELAGAALCGNDLRLAASVKRGLRYLDFALSSPRAAAAQNQVVLCAISRVALALGHDPRRVMAEGHAHATRFGGCAPLVEFAEREGTLSARLDLPLTLEPHEHGRALEAEAALSLARLQEADDARLLSACVGLASQLPLLRAALRQ